MTLDETSIVDAVSFASISGNLPFSRLYFKALNIGQ